MANYLFSLSPTFTQGFILGQLSVLFLLIIILKYLFWNSGPESPLVSLPPRTERKVPIEDLKSLLGADKQNESLEWFNQLVLKIVESYRAQLREHLHGSEADEVVRRKVEVALNDARPSNFTDHIKVHAVELGTSAPRLSRANVDQSHTSQEEQMTHFHVSYQDSISISLSTSILLHYPRPYFARLPIALTLSLAVFASKLLLVLPNPTSTNPSLKFTLPPDFTLEIHTNSLLGSRAKLADVPKVHEMIQSHIRRFLVQRGTWTIVLPTIGGEKASPETTEH